MDYVKFSLNSVNLKTKLSKMKFKALSITFFNKNCMNNTKLKNKYKKIAILKRVRLKKIN